MIYGTHYAVHKGPVNLTGPFRVWGPAEIARFCIVAVDRAENTFPPTPPITFQ